jgi:lipopolysaccharide/colanic/teichoic acid biosynthesis glycosyltransferase
MSFVGPRPDLPGYMDKLIGEDQIVLLVKPGLTGLDSIVFPNEAAILDKQDSPHIYYDEVLFPLKVKINVWYVKNRSFWLDLEIFFRTILGLWDKENKISGIELPSHIKTY